MPLLKAVKHIDGLIEFLNEFGHQLKKERIIEDFKKYMEQIMELIDKSALVAEIDNRIKKYILLQHKPEMSDLQGELQNKIDCLNSIKGYILNTIEVKESDETAKAFARIIRANLTGIDKDVQYKFEQLYKEITGKEMYQGYND